MAINMSEFVPDNNLNWLALAACVYELDKNSLLKMHQSGMSLNQISLRVGANYKTIKRALINSGVEF